MIRRRAGVLLLIAMLVTPAHAVAVDCGPLTGSRFFNPCVMLDPSEVRYADD